MVLTILIFVIASLWLLHRVTRLLKVPAPQLISALGIDIPAVPSITLDGVTSTTVQFHWTPPEKSVAKYVFHLNGIKGMQTPRISLFLLNVLAGETDRLNTAVTLQGLSPNTPYVLNVVAVTSNNHGSHPSSINFYTHRLQGEALPFDPQKLIFSGMFSLLLTSIKANSLDPALNIAAINSPASQVRLRSKIPPLSPGASIGSTTGARLGKNDGTRSSRSKSDTQKSSNDKSIYTVESLELEVELIQAELQEAMGLKARSDAEFASIEEVALKELDSVKSRRKTEDSSRSQLKSESKNLEDSKHQLDIQKLKLDKTNKLRSAELEKKSKEKQTWSDDTLAAKAEVSNVEKSITSIKENGQREIAAAKEEIEKMQRESDELENAIQELSLTVKRLDLVKASSLAALAQMHDNTDEVTGVVSDVYATQFFEKSEVYSKLRDALKADFDHEKNLEKDWIKAQKDLETRYLKVNVMYNEAKEAHEKASQMHNLYVGKDQAIEDGTSDTRLVPTTSNHSTGKRRRNRSRRAVKARASTPSFPSTFPPSSVEPVPSSFQNSSISPSSAKTQPSLSPALSPDLLFSPLCASRNAVSQPVNPPSLLLDAQMPNSAQAGDIYSPTSFLPSDLLKDDMTESRNIFGNTVQNPMQDIHSFNHPVDQQSDAVSRSIHPNTDLIPPSLPSFLSPAKAVSRDVSAIPHQVSPQSSFSHLFQRENSIFSKPVQISTPLAPESPDSSIEGHSTLSSPGELEKNTSRGKFSNMFFFGKARNNQTRSVSSPQVESQTGGSLFFRKARHNEVEVVDMLSPPFAGDMEFRPRSGSLNSVGSLQMSLGESFTASGILNVWGENAPNRSVNSLEPSRSHLSHLSHLNTAISLENNSAGATGIGIIGSNHLNGFDSQPSIGWSPFANRNLSATQLISNGPNMEDKHLKAAWDHMPNDTIIRVSRFEKDSEPPVIIVESTSPEASVESTSPQPNKSLFSKRAIVGLFTSSGDHSRGPSPGSTTLDEQVEYPALITGSVEADVKDSSAAPAKETILQKGIRTFSVRKSSAPSGGNAVKDGKAGANGLEDKAITNGSPIPSKDIVSSPTTKSKFNMRRLGMFSKKDTKDSPLDAAGKPDFKEIVEEHEEYAGFVPSSVSTT